MSHWRIRDRTSLAIVGSYVLAGELYKTNDKLAALRSYEAIMRPFVKEGQNIPKIVPRMLWPQNAFELKLMRAAMRVANNPLVKKLFASSFARDSNQIELPHYAVRQEIGN